MVRSQNTGLTFVVANPVPDTYARERYQQGVLHPRDASHGSSLWVPSLLQSNTVFKNFFVEPFGSNRNFDGGNECTDVAYIDPSSNCEGRILDVGGDEQNVLLAPDTRFSYGRRGPMIALMRGSSSSSSSRQGSSYYVDQWKSTVAITHFLVLIIVVSLTAAFFSSFKDTEGFQNEKISILSETWILATGKCDAWVDGSCIPSLSRDPSKESLGGVLPEFEILNNDWFSSVNALSFSFTASVLATAFSFMLVETDNVSTRHMLSRFAKGILVVSGILFLFVQKEWKIPLNNIVIVGGFILIALLALTIWPRRGNGGIGSSQSSISLCMLSNALTYPLIIVSVLSTVGEDNAISLLGIFVSTFVAWLLMVMAYVEVESQKQMNERLSQLLIMGFWSCFLPFVVICSIRFHNITLDEAVTYPLWATVAFGLMFGSYVLDALWFTFHYYYYYNESPAVSFGSMIIRVFDLIIKYTLFILVVSGYFIEMK